MTVCVLVFAMATVTLVVGDPMSEILVVMGTLCAASQANQSLCAIVVLKLPNMNNQAEEECPLHRRNKEGATGG